MTVSDGRGVRGGIDVERDSKEEDREELLGGASQEMLVGGDGRGV